jgi:hypothetical protein
VNGDVAISVIKTNSNVYDICYVIYKVWLCNCSRSHHHTGHTKVEQLLRVGCAAHTATYL